MGFRVWEFGAGILVHVFDPTRHFKTEKETVIQSLKLPKMLVEGATLLLLISLCVLFAAPLAFGKTAVVISVFQTMALLIVLQDRFFVTSGKDEEELTLTHKVLTNQLFVHIGKISYSLYLWHWGVIVVCKFIFPDNNWWNIIVQLILVYGFSVTSFFIVEKPCRAFTRPPKQTHPGQNQAEPKVSDLRMLRVYRLGSSLQQQS